MAVVDTYVGPEFTPAAGAATAQTVAAGTRAMASRSKGTKVIRLVQTFEVAAADDNNSIYRVFKGLPSTLKPVECTIMSDGLTGGNDYNFGFYLTNGGAEAPTNGSNVLGDAIDLSSASRVLDGLEQMAIEDIGIKSIADLLGVSVEAGTDKHFYDLALTAITAGTGAGTVCVHLTCLAED